MTPEQQRQRDEIMLKLDVVSFYEGEGVEQLHEDPPGSGQYKALCPFHEEDTGSFSISSKGLFYCFGCSIKGSPFDFWMKKHGTTDFQVAFETLAALTGVVEETKPIDDTEVQGWHDALLKLPTKLAYLRDERGITEETIKTWRVGFDGDRYTIPIVALDGTITNVRRYKPRATQKMISYAQNYGGTSLLGASLIASAQVILVGEGEWDAILANQHHFVTVTATNGAGRWRDRWNELFRGKNVVMIQDNDQSGRKGDTMIATKLFSIAASVRIVTWPKDFPEKGDITDWFVKFGRSDAEFQGLIDASITFTPTAEEISLAFAMSEDGNSRRFIEEHGRNLLYVSTWKIWYIWDEVRWRADEVQQVQERAKLLLRTRAEDAISALDKELADFYVRSQSGVHVREMIKFASSDPAVAVTPDDLDRNPWILVCANGVIDLKTGEFLEPDRDDLNTKQASAEYKADARSETWERFLHEVTGGDEELIGFLQRAIGYSITGSVKEEKLFFVHGPTASGKSTFLKAIATMMGRDYSQTMDFQTILGHGDRSSKAESQLAAMKGMRFISSTEIDEGSKLAVGLTKIITGGDKMTGKRLYKDPVEFDPTAKLWLAANTKPHVPNNDPAIWRRVLLVPFDKTFEKPDPAIKEELTDLARSGSAILAWAVKGALMWQRDGLKVPEKIVAATAGYREEQNPITDWYEEEVTPFTGRTPLGDLYLSYTVWGKNNGLRFLISAKRFSKELQGLGHALSEGSGHKRFIDGITLRSAQDAKAETRC